MCEQLLAQSPAQLSLLLTQCATSLLAHFQHKAPSIRPSAAQPIPAVTTTELSSVASRDTWPPSGTSRPERASQPLSLDFFELILPLHTCCTLIPAIVATCISAHLPTADAAGIASTVGTADLLSSAVSTLLPCVGVLLPSEALQLRQAALQVLMPALILAARAQSEGMGSRG